METLFIKIHRNQNNTMIAVCDKEVLGKEFEYNGQKIVVSDSFYKGEEKIKKDVIELLKSATTANILGEKAVLCAIEAGIIDQDSVMYIDGVPHALYFLI